MEDKIIWVKNFSRRFTLFKLDIYIKFLRVALKNRFKYELKNVLAYGNGLEVVWYFNPEEWKNGFGQLVLNHFIESVEEKKEPYAIFEEYYKNLINAAKEITKRRIETKEEILAAYEEFIKKFEDFQIVIWLPAWAEEKLFPYAKERLMKYANDEKAWEIISVPFKPSLIQQEQIELLEAAADLSEEKLEEHCKKYCWMNMAFVEDEPYDMNYYRDAIRKISKPKDELKKIKGELARKESEFFKLIDALKVNEYDRKLFIFANKINHLRQTRDAGRRQAYYYVKPLFEKMLGLFSTDFDTLLNLTHDELVEAIKKGRIEKKRNILEYIYMIKDGVFEFITEGIKERLIEEGIIADEVNDIAEIKGITANKGKAKGMVKVIRLSNVYEDLKNFEEGNILVAASTKAEYVPAMKKAAAFVTDEGGATCHAAIVSREMGRPCIVGTKIATRLLKDGDMVEVDADNGVVRRIVP